MTQVFISYSRKDISFINRLAADLKNAGLDVWYDVSGIAGSTLAKRERECPAQQPVCDCGAFARLDYLGMGGTRVFVFQQSQEKNHSSDVSSLRASVELCRFELYRCTG